jgi:hypothetical protein
MQTMPRTIPDDVVEGVDELLRILQAMMSAAQHQARKKPTVDGLSCCRFGRHQPKLIALVVRTPSG